MDFPSALFLRPCPFLALFVCVGVQILSTASSQRAGESAERGTLARSARSQRGFCVDSAESFRGFRAGSRALRASAASQPVLSRSRVAGSIFTPYRRHMCLRGSRVPAVLAGGAAAASYRCRQQRCPGAFAARRPPCGRLQAFSGTRTHDQPERLTGLGGVDIPPPCLSVCA